MIFSSVDQFRPCSGISVTCFDWIVVSADRVLRHHLLLLRGDGDHGRGPRADFQREIPQRHRLERVQSDIGQDLVFEAWRGNCDRVFAGNKRRDIENAEFIRLTHAFRVRRRLNYLDLRVRHHGIRGIDDRAGYRSETCLTERTAAQPQAKQGRDRKLLH